MFELNTLIRLFDRGFLLRSLYFLLLFALVPVAEIALLIYLSRLFGVFLVLAVLLATGLFGMVASFGEMKRSLVRLKARVREGSYPDSEFRNLAGTIIASLFLVTPGFLSDLAGLVLFFPAVRRRVGHAVTLRMESKMKEIYEYLKMYDL
jgi:UPF0716 protein FxsA